MARLPPHQGVEITMMTLTLIVKEVLREDRHIEPQTRLATHPGNPMIYPPLVVVQEIIPHVRATPMIATPVSHQPHSQETVSMGPAPIGPVVFLNRRVPAVVSHPPLALPPTMAVIFPNLVFPLRLILFVSVLMNA